MKKVFSEKKYIENCKESGIPYDKFLWYKGLDGKEVINNHIGEYIIDDDWCEIVEDDIKTEDDIKAYAIPSDEIITKENLKQAIKESLLEIIGG